MSEENVEIVRRAGELLRASFASGQPIDGLLELCAPDICIDASRRVFNPDMYGGVAGVRSAIEEIHASWEDFDAVTERLVDLGDRVAAIQTISGRGRASKAEVRARGALIWTVSEGRIQRIEIYTQLDEALAGLGLAE